MATPAKRTQTTARSVTAKPGNAKSGNAKSTTTRSATIKSGTTKTLKRKSRSMTEESDEDDEDYGSDSEEAFGSRTSTHSSNSQGGARKIKKEMSTSDVATASMRGKYQRSATPSTSTKKARVQVLKAYSEDDTVSAEDTSVTANDNGVRYVAAGASFLELEGDESGRFEKQAARKTVPNKGLKVTFSMKSDSGLKLLKQYAGPNELDSSVYTENENDRDLAADQGIDEGDIDGSVGSQVSGQDYAEDEADVDGYYVEESGAAEVPMQQHMFVDTIDHLPAVEASTTQYSGFGFQSGGLSAAGQFETDDYGSNEFGNHERSDMAFNDSFVNDAFHHDPRFFNDDEPMQLSSPVAVSNSAFATDNFHKSLGPSKLYSQTDFARQATLPANTNGYYAPNLSNEIPISGTTGYIPGFMPQFDDCPSSSTQWLHDNPLQENLDFKPTGFAYGN